MPITTLPDFQGAIASLIDAASYSACFNLLRRHVKQVCRAAESCGFGSMIWIEKSAHDDGQLRVREPRIEVERTFLLPLTDAEQAKLISILSRWQERKPATPQSGAHFSAHRPSELMSKIGCGNDTLRKYAHLAGVTTPRRGKRNHVYSVSECVAIFKAIIQYSSDDRQVTTAKRLLEDAN